MTSVAWVALGANLGHRGRALACLRAALQREGVTLEAESREVPTRPVGVTAQEDFHNHVVRLRSPEPWSAQRWLQHCKAAERSCGRRESYRWGPRAADADVLLLGEHGEVHVQSGDLVVPHPELPNREFLGRLLRELGLTAGEGEFTSP